MGSIPTGFSASRVSALFGLNRYKTPFEAWQELMEEFDPGFNAKKGFALQEKPDSAAIRWGKKFEESIISRSEFANNCPIIDLEKSFSKEIDIGVTLTCHVDGIAIGNQFVHEGKTTNIRAYTMFSDGKMRWGDPGTDQVPEEYQIQAGVIRICTEIDLVKLSVMVFPRPVDELENEGWTTETGFTWLENKTRNLTILQHDMALILDKLGFFHIYNLPKNEPLESAIKESMKRIYNENIITGKPPELTNYDDVKRYLSRPCGTIIADEDLEKICNEYSEVTRQLGNSGPLAKRKETLKVDILKRAIEIGKTNENDPDDKIEIVSEKGGYKLASFSLDKNGNQTFRAKKAK